MKKTVKSTVYLVIVFFLATTVLLVGCSSPDEEQPEEQIDYEIALVTDEGLLMDGGSNEKAWETVTKFGSENGISHKYYKATEATKDACIQAIDSAIHHGAKIIMADGQAFREAVITEQQKNPDVKFILIDSAPAEGVTEESTPIKNTLSIEFNSAQAGYLAGYGAVVNGYVNLGFIGNEGDATITDYGYGFLQGVNNAAGEQNITVNVKYHYCKSEDGRDEVSETAEAWYRDNTEVIFACGSAAELPVMEAAEITDKKVIACDTDKSQISDRVITSATKNIGEALETALQQYIEGDFPRGKTAVYDASNEGVGLVLGDEGFENLQKYEYGSVIKQMNDGEITVLNHTAGSAEALDLIWIKLNEL